MGINTKIATRMHKKLDVVTHLFAKSVVRNVVLTYKARWGTERDISTLKIQHL